MNLYVTGILAVLGLVLVLWLTGKTIDHWVAHPPVTQGYEP